jgi:hypothetical protein
MHHFFDTSLTSFITSLPLKIWVSYIFFLGIEVTTQQTGLVLTQSRYIYSILERTNMLGAKSVKTPMATSPTLSKFEGESMSNPSLYRSIVGALQYVTITRPDVAFAVNRVSQYMHNPTVLH